MKDIKTYITESSNKVKVYLMVGIPGSGKSTWISNNLSKDIPVVSRDIIRVELGYVKSVDEKFVGTRDQENKVTEIENEYIEKYIKEKRDFVIDDTNTGKYRAGLIDRLHSFGAHVIGINMNTSLETCIERRREQIPEKVMRDIYSRRIPIKASEVDELINAKGE